MPAIRITIPADIPESIILTDKEGNRKEANARALYSRAFKQGWEEYWNRYKEGKVDLADEWVEPAPVSEYGIEGRGRTDGFRQCRLATIASKR